MATYTLTSVTFTTAQEAGLDLHLFIANQEIAAINAQRASQVPPLAPLPLATKQTYLQSLVDRWPIAFMNDFRQDFTKRSGAVMLTTSVANLLSVATTLGIDPNPYD